jgi:putative colanic acid biosynthesis UDP-glucose lipid carrier transferase
MLKGQQINYLFRLSLDLLLLFVCFVLSFRLLNGYWLGWTKQFYPSLLILSFVIWYFSARIFHFYTSVTLFSYSQELTIFLRLLSLHLLLLIFILVLFVEPIQVYRNFLLLYHGMVIVSFPFLKYIYRVSVAFIRSQYKYVRNILVVGSSDISSSIYRSGMLINNLQYAIVGFVGERPSNGYANQFLGPIENLPTILQSTKIDEVFLSLPSHQVEQINYVIDLCEQQHIQVNVINDFNRIGGASMRVTNYAGFPVVGLRYFPLDDAENRFFKRLFDIVFSSIVILLVLSWLTPLLAILIKINSRGPVFFRQERWGLNNEKILCFKFRTMKKISSENGEAEIFKQTEKNDARVTGIGKFLRKSSLDELPQFINVFLGSMSIVGPRPHPIPLSMESKDIVQHYMLRHLVKPGITGWAQVNGSRGEIHNADEMRKRVGFDLWYIENWSFWIDCQIIFQTIVNLIKGDEKAY